jgi:type II secretory pathway pseudopilin PulG
MPLSNLNTTTGISLIETAIALIIISLLINSSLIPLSTQVDQDKVKSTQKYLEDIKEALLGFALLEKRLPCPDTKNNDGVEDGTCLSEGNLPWATLGIEKHDAWEHPFRYRVEADFADTAKTAALTFSSTLRVVNRQGTYLTTKANSEDSRIAALVFSCGKNNILDDNPINNNIKDNKGSNIIKTTSNLHAVCTHLQEPDNLYVEEAYIKDRFDNRLVWISKNNLVHGLIDVEIR